MERVQGGSRVFEPPIQQRSEEPRTVDLASLESIIDDNQFLEEAYRRILGREPDLEGLLHHRESLHNGTPRATILHRFTNSEEARLRYGSDGEGTSSTIEGPPETPSSDVLGM